MSYHLGFGVLATYCGKIMSKMVHLCQPSNETLEGGVQHISKNVSEREMYCDFRIMPLKKKTEHIIVTVNSPKVPKIITKV